MVSAERETVAVQVGEDEVGSVQIPGGSFGVSWVKRIGDGDGEKREEKGEP